MFFQEPSKYVLDHKLQYINKDNDTVKLSKSKTRIDFFILKNNQNCNSKDLQDYCVKEEQIYSSMNVDDNLSDINKLVMQEVKFHG